MRKELALLLAVYGMSGLMIVPTDLFMTRYMHYSSPPAPGYDYRGAVITACSLVILVLAALLAWGPRPRKDEKMPFANMPAIDAVRIPLPNDEFDDGTVVASVWQDDDAGTALILLLRQEVPFFSVCDIEWRDGSWLIVNEDQHMNIVPAVDAYKDAGGDY